MDLWLWVARSVAATVLGIIVFVAFLSFLLVNHFTGRLLEPAFYTRAIIEHDAYSRVYDEVLLDDAVRASTRQFTGDLQLMTHEELVELVREDIAPPEYVQEQVEGNVELATEYMRGEVDVLDLQVDLGRPLARIRPALFARLDQRIDELETVSLDPDRSLLEQVAQARQLAETSIRSLGSGAMPASVPSVAIIPEPFRADLFDVMLPDLLRDPGLDRHVRNSLEANSAELKNAFIAGDTHHFLKVATRAVVNPMLDDALARLRQNLDSQDRLDVVETVARSNEKTEEELRADIEKFRDRLSRAQKWGKTIALPVGVAAIVVMVLIYLPSLTNALRWPGLTLLLTGGVLYLLAKILENTLPERLNDLIDSSVAGMSQLPPSAADLITDISRSLVERSVEGMATPALVLLTLGAVLFVSSFLIFLLKPYMPGLR